MRLLKTRSLDDANLRVLIGFAVMVQYMSHYTMAKLEVTCTSSFCCFFFFYKIKLAQVLIFINILWLFLITTREMVRYEMVIIISYPTSMSGIINNQTTNIF